MIMNEAMKYELRGVLADVITEFLPKDALINDFKGYDCTLKVNGDRMVLYVRRDLDNGLYDLYKINF